MTQLTSANNTLSFCCATSINMLLIKISRGRVDLVGVGALEQSSTGFPVSDSPAIRPTHRAPSFHLTMLCNLCTTSKGGFGGFVSRVCNIFESEVGISLLWKGKTTLVWPSDSARVTSVKSHQGVIETERHACRLTDQSSGLPGSDVKHWTSHMYYIYQLSFRIGGYTTM